MLDVMNFGSLMTNITFFWLNVAKTWRTHATEKNLMNPWKIIFKLPIKAEQKQLNTAFMKWNNKYV